jgi:serine/threonine protein phosphatase 1
MEKRRFVIGDIHGKANALNEVLDLADFNDDVDQLITLGDIVDGGEQTFDVVDRLLHIKDRIDIRGNHDEWFVGWINSDPRIIYVNYLWQNQGGYATQRSYDYNVLKIPEEHKDLFRNQVLYYIDNKNNIFVHGGFNPEIMIEFQEPETIMWDRDLIKYAREQPVAGYNKVYVGHTSVQWYKKKATPNLPLTFNNLVMMDCGGGWTGRLAMLNVDNHAEIYASKKQRRPRRSPFSYGTN